MELVEETITMGFTQKIGDFEFLRTDVELRARFNTGDTLDEVHDKLYAATEEKLIDSAKEIYGQLSADAKRKTKINPE